MTASFLQEPPVSPQVQALYDEDLADGGGRDHARRGRVRAAHRELTKPGEAAQTDDRVVD
jgi:hypothetical protein